MKNNLPIKEDKSFLGKIKRFFAKLFCKNIVKSHDSTNVESMQEPINNSTKFAEDIKFETKNEYIKDMEKEEFLDNLEKKPELFYELSVEKLEKLEEYYKESIKKYEEKLEKIKKAS